MRCKDNLDRPIIAVLVTTIVAVCFGVNVLVGAFGTTKKMDGFLSLVVYVFLFYMVCMCVKEKDVKLFLYGMYSVAVLSSIYGICQMHGIGPYIDRWNAAVVLHPNSTFGNVAFFSAYMAMTVPLLLHSVFKSKWLIPVLILVLYTLFECGQRAAVVAFAVSLIYFACMYRKEIVKRTAFGILCIMGLSVICLHDTLIRKFLGGSQIRIDMAVFGWQIILDHFWTGIGPDNLVLVWKQYSGFARNQGSLHNEVLDVFAETGVFGLCAWLYFLISYFRIVWKNRSSEIVVALSSAVVAYLVQNQFSYSTMPLVLTFWVLIGLTLVAIKKEDSEFKRHGIDYY